MTSTFRALDPRTGRPRGPDVAASEPGEAGAAADRAAAAFEVLRRLPLSEHARLVGAVAGALEAAAADPGLLEAADAETGLGAARLGAEWARTVAQARAFEALAASGTHVEAVLDPPDAGAVPPRGDLRRMLVPIGPVAVFGASNFPFAFGVPGCDTVAALAAGCPVVAKGHPAHPETSARAGRLVEAALVEAGAPPGTFTLVQGPSPDVGRALVLAPEIAAVAFTGSLAGGRALYDLAATRPVPIPVYAEMGSINPVFVTEAACRARGDAIAAGLAASMCAGTGQYCTSPGLVAVPHGDAGDGLVARLAAAVRDAELGWLLSPSVRDQLAARIAATRATAGVAVVVEGAAGGDGLRHPALVFETDTATVRAHPHLLEEHFGPVAIVVRVRDADDARALARACPGTLTATIHAEAAEVESLAPLRDVLLARAGRIVWNGYPTGVAIAPAMHHGGPYPAATHPGFTSVGQLSVRRFLRPVTFQDAPAAALPLALRDGNPLGIPRMVAGRWTS